MKIFKSLLVIATLISLTGGVTAAYFTSSVTAVDNQVNAGTMLVNLNNKSNPTLGPALFLKNGYPGAFVESSGLINNDGDIAFNPSISVANAANPDGMLSYLWLEVWTEGKLWYSGWLNQAPGYTTNKVTLDTIAPGEDVSVTFRLILDESAPNSVQGGHYEVDTVITAFQTNDPTGVTTTYTSGAYHSSGFSYPRCGVRSGVLASPYYSYDQPTWSTSTYPYVGTNMTVAIDGGTGYMYCEIDQ